MAIKEPNRVSDDRKKVAMQAAKLNLAAGKGGLVVAADHVSGETCAQTIARATV